MSTPSRKPTRRPPDDDPGYEVVDDAPPRRARVVKADPLDDPGFEVVEDEPPPVKKKKRPVVAVEDDEDDDRPVRRRHRDDDDEERVVPRKKKRKRPRFEDDEVKSHSTAWWVVPVFLIGLGLAFSLIGAAGSASSAKNPTAVVGTGIILGLTFVQFIISVPISIIALVIGGKLFGIEYGSPLMAITNIAAICSMMMGLDWLLTWIGLWPSAIFTITVIVSISLLMTLFQLDTWEVIVSLICIKVVTFLSFMAMVVLVFAALVSGGGGNNFDDDPDDRPQIKQKQKMDGNRNPAGNRGRGNPDPDDDE